MAPTSVTALRQRQARTHAALQQAARAMYAAHDVYAAQPTEANRQAFLAANAAFRAAFDAHGNGGRR